MQWIEYLLHKKHSILSFLRVHYFSSCDSLTHVHKDCFLQWIVFHKTCTDMKTSWGNEHFQHASQHWPSVHFLCHTKYRSTSIQSRFAIYQYGCSRYLHHFLQKGMLESITSFDFSVIIINVNIEIVLCSKTFPTVFAFVLKQGWKMNTFNMLQ